MSRAEKYLPFILAVFLPLTSALRQNQEPIEDPTVLLFRLSQAATSILFLWYANKWILYNEFRLERVIGKVGSTILLNSMLIGILVVINELLLDRVSEDIPSWLLMIRLTIVTVILNVILRILKNQRERSILKVQNLELKAENLNFQIETLKQQINPHFLFNSLNTLLDLIEENQEAAIKYVRSFSNLYRIVLQSAQHDFIPLSDELKFLEYYWELLKVRFQSAIDLKVKINDEKRTYLIPPLCLQFLVENAVKHNESSKMNPLLIELIEDNGFLIVKNKVRLKTYPVTSEKVGLRNLQKRFTLLFKPIEYGQEQDYFIVKIPLKMDEE